VLRVVEKALEGLARGPLGEPERLARLGVAEAHDRDVRPGRERSGARDSLTLLRQRSGSVVLDLSQLDADSKAEHLADLPALMDVERAVWGGQTGSWSTRRMLPLRGGSGLARLPSGRSWLLLGDVSPRGAVAGRARARRGDDPGVGIWPGRGVACAAARAGRPPREIVVGGRRSPHRRRWHNYAAAALPPIRAFGFRRPDGQVTERAPDLVSFVRGLEWRLRGCSPTISGRATSRVG
jgi:hypothetical protein